MTAAAGRAETTFRYRAARLDGSMIDGTVTATDDAAAVETLIGRGLHPVRLRATATHARAHAGRLGGEDLATGLQSLAVLLEAGLPVARALSVMETLAAPTWQPLLASAQRDIREGRSLADALGRAPSALPDVVIDLVRAGEAGSGLAPAVRRAAEQVEQQAALRASLRSALTYPAIVAATGAATVALLVGVILPRFVVLLSDLGSALPWSTRLVLAAGETATAMALPTTTAIALGAVLWRAWVARPGGRATWHELLRAVPGVGTVRRAAATSRVCAALGALLDAGVPLANALAHAGTAGGDAAVARRLTAVRQDVVRGSRLSDAVVAHDALTPTAARLLHAGDASGAVARMLGHAARLEADRAQRGVRAAVRVVEPLLILVLGGTIAFVAAALLQAVYAIRPGS